MHSKKSCNVKKTISSQRELAPLYRVESLEDRVMYSADHLVINEFMASNGETLSDENGDFPDWIEIYNPTGESVDLLGWSLTDDAAELDKWEFPDVSLASGEYMVVFASSKDRMTGELHTNFKLSAGGEYLGLVDSDLLVVHAYEPTYPGQSKDQSYGLVSGVVGSDTLFLEASPGSANLQPEISDLVEFSREGSSFITSFSLSMSSGLAGSVIRYTTNGSVPSGSSSLYTGPITISTTTNVRAIVLKTGYADSRVTSGNFTKLSVDVRNFTSDLPIVVIENWGGGRVPNKGYSSSGAGVTQVARQVSNLSIYGDKDQAGNALYGTPTVDTRMGNRVRGAYSSTFEFKSFSVETWGETNEEQNINPFGFGEESDWILYYAPGRNGSTPMNNTIMWDLSSQMGHWAPKFQYVELFLNTGGGELSMADYSGIYVLMEKVKGDKNRLDIDRLSEDGSEGGWLVSINRMDAEPIGGGSPQYFHTAGPDLVRGTGDDIPRQGNAFLNFDSPNGYRINTAQRASIEDWMFEFESALYGDNWLDPTEGYQKYLDVDSFVDYFILHNVTNNSDGLLLSMWIYKESSNGKLKMGPIWDLDLAAMGGSGGSLLNRMDRLWYGRLFSDVNFMQAYIDRWQELRGGVLSKDNLWDTARPMAAAIGVSATSLVNNLISRFKWIDPHYTSPVIVRDEGDVSAGTVVTLDGGGSEVYYTLDGSDPRLSDGSVSPDAILLGDGDPDVIIGKGSSWRYLDDGSDQGTAWVEDNFQDRRWKVGEGQLGYGDGDEATVVSYGGDSSNKHITTYFRRRVMDFDPSLYSSYRFEVLRDDGAVIYINGVEVGRMNFDSVVGDPMDYLTPSLFASEETSYFSFIVPASFFVSGANMIAVEIHQGSGSSSDISFDLKLSGVPAGGESVLAAVTIDSPVVLAVRTKSGNGWGGLVKREFTVDGVGIAALPVVISEINYNPKGPTAGELLLITESIGVITGADFEYIELTGILDGEGAIDLNGLRLEDSTGLIFEFKSGQSMFDGGRIVLVRNQEAFVARYGQGAAIIMGEYLGKLSNSGEQLRLVDKNGRVIHDFMFDDSGAWPGGADGLGDSLHRLVGEGLGNDGGDWVGAPPSPGAIHVAGDYTGDGFVGGGDVAAVRDGFGTRFRLSDLFMVRNNYPHAVAVAVAAGVVVPDARVYVADVSGEVGVVTEGVVAGEVGVSVVITEVESEVGRKQEGDVAELTECVLDDVGDESEELGLLVLSREVDVSRVKRDSASLYDLLFEGDDEFFWVF